MRLSKGVLTDHTVSTSCRWAQQPKSSIVVDALFTRTQSYELCHPTYLPVLVDIGVAVLGFFVTHDPDLMIMVE